MYVQYLVQSGDIQEVAVQPREAVGGLGNGHSRLLDHELYPRNLNIDFINYTILT